jgi:hypothetical protein
LGAGRVAGVGLVAGPVDVAFGLAREAVALGREPGAAVFATPGRAARLSLRR